MVWPVSMSAADYTQKALHNQTPLPHRLPFLNTQLFSHQASGISRILYLLDTQFAGCILADMKGLGKTLTTIAVSILDQKRHGKFDLILTTESRVSRWEEEFMTHVKPVCKQHGLPVSYERGV